MVERIGVEKSGKKTKVPSKVVKIVMALGFLKVLFCFVLVLKRK